MSEDPPRLEVHGHALGFSALESEFVICSSSTVRLRDEEGRFRYAGTCRGHDIAPLGNAGQRRTVPVTAKSARSAQNERTGFGAKNAVQLRPIACLFLRQSGIGCGEGGGGAGRAVTGGAATGPASSSTYTQELKRPAELPKTSKTPAYGHDAGIGFPSARGAILSSTNPDSAPIAGLPSTCPGLAFPLLPI